MATQDQIRDQITNQIIEALEENKAVPWHQPWIGIRNGGRPANVVSSNPYRGINPLLLSLHQQRHGFRSKWYGTFKQWQRHGRADYEKAHRCAAWGVGLGIIYYCPITKTVTDPITGEESEEK